MSDCEDFVDINLEDVHHKPSQPFCCPISKELMVDPVILVADYQTYDKSNLEQWFKIHGDISPINKEPLNTTEFIPNLAIKTQIDEYNEEKTKTEQNKFQSYFSNVSKQTNTSNAIRLLLIGDCGVGKSSIKRFIEFNNADPFIQPTLGIDSAYVHFNQSYTNSDIIVQITDICGQDRFRSLTKQCYRNIHGVILLCSLDCPDSVMNLKGSWSDDVFENAPDDIYGIVVVNKCDLLHSAEANMDESMKGKINKYETLMRSAVQFANFIQYPVYCTSTITGEYIHAAFADIVYRISKDTLMWDMIQHNPLRTGNIRLDDKPLKVVGCGSGGCVCVAKSVFDFGYDQMKKKH